MSILPYFITIEPYRTMSILPYSIIFFDFNQKKWMNFVWFFSQQGDKEKDEQSTKNTTEQEDKAVIY